MIRKVLCISHNKAMNYLIRTVLANSYQLVVVEDVFHGMHQLKKRKDISLIIIDIDYQTKESIDFILHIDSSKFYEKPVIVLSSVQNGETNASILKAHVTDCFIKPFNPIELVDSIHEHIMSVSLS